MRKLYERESKYLAYDIENKEIFELSKIDFIDKWVHKKNSIQVYKFEDVELLEYSGNQDINGKDIYEGHILLDPKTGFYYEVLFIADRFVLERNLQPFRAGATQQTNPSSISFTASSLQWLLGSSQANYKENKGYELADLYPFCEELEVVGFIFELIQKVGYSKLYDQKSKN
jgi:hypothetical protein